MLKYPIDPEYCLILNAFVQTTSLRAAAVLLGTEPASLVRKVQRIASEHGYLQKVGNRWVVTEAGRRVAQWTEEVLRSQSLLKEEKPRLRIGAFTWLAEEMLIPQSLVLQDLFRNQQQFGFRMIASDLEQELLSSRVDFIVTGHAPNDPAVAHRKLISLPWVVVVPKAWRGRFQKTNSAEAVQILNTLPFVRHSKMNPEQVLEFQPQVFSNFNTDSVIGLRSAVANGLGWTLLPAMAAQSDLRDGGLQALPVKTMIKDDVSVWWLRARKDSAQDSKIICQWIEGFSLEKLPGRF